MDNYKLGNLICSLRESHNLTQKEFADMINVSDKAVSKWENGQAIPRMETFEKIAEVLDTTVEELIIASKDNIKRVLIKNEFGTTLHIEIDGEITSFKTDEEKWVILDSSKNEYKFVAYGDIHFAEIIDEIEPENTVKEKLAHKGMKALSRWLDKEINKAIIKTKCTYTVGEINNDEVITVENVMFSAGDRMWISKNLAFSFAKLNCNANITLINAECTNPTDAFSSFKRFALTSELGISIPFMLLAYPFRKRYFKRVLKPKGLMKFINKSDYYVAKNKKENEKEKRRKHPFLRLIGIFLLIVIVWFGSDTVFGIIGVKNEKPYLISADFSTITYSREVYSRIDELPKDAIPNTFMGATVWDDARIDGYSKSDQYFDENKVLEYTDKKGNTYLWLVPDYLDTITDPETGDYLEYEDFDNPYVYMLEK